MLNASSPIPLYHQLAERLTAAIGSGRFAIGERIPSEHALAETYGIGRPTVRQATELLVRRGVLQRRRGAGTFVAGKAEALDLFAPGGTLAAFRERGVEVRPRLLGAVALAPVDAGADNPFAGREAYLVRRLSETGAGPALLEETYLDPDVFPDLPGRGLGNASLSTLVRVGYGLAPTGGRQELSVRPLDGARARALDLDEGAPALLVRRHLDFPHGKSAIYAELFHRTDRVVLHQDLVARVGGAG